MARQRRRVGLLLIALAAAGAPADPSAGGERPERSWVSFAAVAIRPALVLPRWKPGVAYHATADPGSGVQAYAALATELGSHGSRDRDALPEPVLLVPPAGVLEEEGAPLEVADRWRVLERLGAVRERAWNPYLPNTLKGDRPIYGREWFLDVSLESHTAFETASRPFSAVAGARRSRAPSESYARQGVIASLSLIRGDTVFRPPDWQLRAAAELGYRSALAPGFRLLRGEPLGARRAQRALGLRELFAEKHLRTKSDRYDFDSVRVGLQPFVSDYRCFVFCDAQPGVRLFGNSAGNRFQYNLAAFRRLQGEPGSERSSLRLRRADVLVANLYGQDLPVPGFQLQGTLIYDRGRERGEVASLAGGAASERASPVSLARDVAYLGVSGDGHLDRLNLSFSAYAAAGSEHADPLGERAQQVRALFGAVEASLDFDWYRLELHALYASGDRDPSDGRAGGFAALRDEARFGGLEDGYLYGEPLALAPQAGIALAGGLLPALRSARSEQLSSFIGPGLRVLGVGGEFDVLPELRLRLHASYLDFDDTASLSALLAREGRAGDVDRHLGAEASAALIYRPLFINNIVLRASLAALRPGRGLRDALGAGGDRALCAGRLEIVLRY